MKQVHIIMNEKPIETNNGWSLVGIGDIEADYGEVESSIFLYLKVRSEVRNNDEKVMHNSMRKEENLG